MIAIPFFSTRRPTKTWPRRGSDHLQAYAVRRHAAPRKLLAEMRRDAEERRRLAPQRRPAPGEEAGAAPVRALHDIAAVDGDAERQAKRPGERQGEGAALGELRMHGNRP